MAQLAAPYEVHQGQIEAGKKAFTEGAAGVFGKGKEQKANNHSALVARLHQEIGQLGEVGVSCQRGPVQASDKAVGDDGLGTPVVVDST